MNGGDESTDVVVIGAGAGGLTTAIILLGLGYRATLIEKNALPGGVMRNYVRRGIACPVGVHYVGSLGDGQPLRRMFDYLGVGSALSPERMGADGIIDWYLFGNFSFSLPEGIAPFEQNLKRAFPRDRHIIALIMRNLREVADQMHRLDVLFSSNRHLFLEERYTESLGGLLTKLKASPGLRSLMGMTCSWIGVPLDECPIFFHHMALVSYLFSSWRCNGTQMADAFSARVAQLGGVILTGDPVEKILIQQKHVAGVVLASGSIIRAPTVVAAVHPKSMLSLLPADAVRPLYVDRIRRLQDTHGVFCAHFSVNAKDHKEVPHNIFTVKTDAAGGIADVIFYQLRASGKPGIHLLTMITSIEPEDWRCWEQTRTGHRGADYVKAKQQKAQALISEAAEVFGPLRGCSYVDAYTHLTLRDWVDAPDGSAYGVCKSTRQMTRASMLNRTSVQGLYLAGQNVLAPGIFGTTMGSFYTVRQIIGSERFRDEVILS